MKSKKSSRTLQAILFVAILTFATDTFAAGKKNRGQNNRRQNNRVHKGCDQIPLDGGLSFLVLGAAAFGVKKLRDKRNDKS